jgi:hypothetical protein
MTYTVGIYEVAGRGGMVLLEEHTFTVYEEAARFAAAVEAEGGLFVTVE